MKKNQMSTCCLFLYFVLKTASSTQVHVRLLFVWNADICCRMCNICRPQCMVGCFFCSYTPYLGILCSIHEIRFLHRLLGWAAGRGDVVIIDHFCNTNPFRQLWEELVMFCGLVSTHLLDNDSSLCGNMLRLKLEVRLPVVIPCRTVSFLLHHMFQLSVHGISGS